MVDPYSNLPESLHQLWQVEEWCQQRILVAVSGGADSVGLLRALHGLAQDHGLIHVAHFNHGWRGQDSDDDQQFVSQLCQALRLHCLVGHWSDWAPADAKHSRSEETARQVRYQFLAQKARELGARYIVTAHTASDRVETLLHNLCRGTGLAGACSPTFVRPLDDHLLLVKPLLTCFREDVLNYLQSLKQSYCVDSSNENQEYSRNFLRQSILPSLRQHYGSEVDRRLLSFSQIVEQTVAVEQAIADQYWKLAQDAAEHDSFLVREIGKGADQYIVIPQASRLSVAWPVVLQSLQQAWHRRGWSLQGMSRSHWTKIQELWLEPFATPGTAPGQAIVSSRRGGLTLPGAIRVSIFRDWIIFDPQAKIRSNKTN
jgi:tRNA(Ile)-lysidine synthase